MQAGKGACHDIYLGKGWVVRVSGDLITYWVYKQVSSVLRQGVLILGV